MPKVLAYMISRATTPQRLELFKDSIKGAIETAGCEFDLSVHYSTNEAQDVIIQFANTPHFSSYNWVYNVGQHVITNFMINEAQKGGYDYLLRLDDDIKFLTKRWLVKMLEAAEKLGPSFIISPTIMGLNKPPESTEVVEKDGVAIKVLVNAIGGICRLHNVETLCDSELPYVSDVRLPLGAGDATGIAEWAYRCQAKGRPIWMVYLNNVRVKHAKGTLIQEKEDPVYHAVHGLFQVMPYIPIWRGEMNESSYSGE